MEPRYSAPAKVILFGEHAVVYGEPALAIPVASLRAYATISPGSGCQIVALDTHQTMPLPVDSVTVDNALTRMAQLTLQHLGSAPPDATITIRSDIPLASGLGSGAAVSAAVGRAVAAAVGASLTNEALNALVYDIERMHHGTPSGIDNTVIVYEQPVFFVRGQPIETFRAAKTMHLLIGDTGQKSLTHVTVGEVRRRYKADVDETRAQVAQIGVLTREARIAIQIGDLERVGALMTRNHSLLRALTVSSEALETLVSAAESAGALGAKLSGGGRGGNMIALATPSSIEAVTQALYDAGAVRVLHTRLEPVST